MINQLTKAEIQNQGLVCLWVDHIKSCEFQESFCSWFVCELAKEF